MAGCWISVRHSSDFGALEAELRSERKAESALSAAVSKTARAFGDASNDVAPHAHFLRALSGNREAPAWIANG